MSSGQLDEPPADQRREVALRAVADHGVSAAIAMTTGWRLPTPSKSGEGSGLVCYCFQLSGAVRVLVELGALPPNAPWLPLFWALVGPVELVPLDDDRIDQRRWPSARDVALARWTIGRVELPQPLDEIVRDWDRAAQESGPDPMALERSMTMANTMLFMARMAAELDGLDGDNGFAMWQQLVSKEPLRGLQVTAERERFERALTARALPAGLVEMVSAGVAAAWQTRTGSAWTAYHAHRRLPSVAASLAGQCIQQAAELDPRWSWDEFGAEVVRLAALVE